MSQGRICFQADMRVVHNRISPGNYPFQIYSALVKSIPALHLFYEVAFCRTFFLGRKGPLWSYCPDQKRCDHQTSKQRRGINVLMRSHQLILAEPKPSHGKDCHCVFHRPWEEFPRVPLKFPESCMCNRMRCCIQPSP